MKRCTREFQMSAERTTTAVIRSNVIVMLVLLTAGGCGSVPNRYPALQSRDELRRTHADVRFTYGQPDPVLDRMQMVAELPSRVMQGGRLNANQHPDEDVYEILVDYLQQNGLSDVPVLVNHYDPAGQWRRLYENEEIPPFWKYTAGTWTVASYTIFPGRVLRRDEYDPFTNTLSFNSGRLSDVLHAAAYAKDVHTRDYPGPYASVNLLPGVAIWKTTNAVTDIVHYAQARECWHIESDVYRDQYPQVAVQTMMPAGFFLTPIGNVVLAASGGAVGYAVGRTVEQQRLAEIQAEQQRQSRDASPPGCHVDLVGHSFLSGDDPN